MRAERIADIDAEEFYDFTQVRPKTRFDKSGDRYIKWPANEFSYLTNGNPNSGIMVFNGVEPNLKWRTFSKTVLSVAQEHQVELIISLGSLLDAVPHTRDIRISGRASNKELNKIIGSIKKEGM